MRAKLAAMTGAVTETDTLAAFHVMPQARQAGTALHIPHPVVLFGGPAPDAAPSLLQSARTTCAWMRRMRARATRRTRMARPRSRRRVRSRPRRPQRSRWWPTTMQSPRCVSAQMLWLLFVGAVQVWRAGPLFS